MKAIINPQPYKRTCQYLFVVTFVFTICFILDHKINLFLINTAEARDYHLHMSPMDITPEPPRPQRGLGGYKGPDHPALIENRHEMRPDMDIDELERQRQEQSKEQERREAKRQEEEQRKTKARQAEAETEAKQRLKARKDYVRGYFGGKMPSHYPIDNKQLEEDLSNSPKSLIYDTRKRIYYKYDLKHLEAFLEYIDLQLQLQKKGDHQSENDQIGWNGDIESWEEEKKITQDQVGHVKKILESHIEAESEKYQRAVNGTTLQREIVEAGQKMANEFDEVRDRLLANFQNSLQDPVFKNFREFQSTVTYTAATLNYALIFSDDNSTQFKEYGQEDAEKISSILLKLAQNTVIFAKGAAKGIGTGITEDLQGIAHLPEVVQVLSKVTWDAVKNPATTVNALIDMAQTFDYPSVASKLSHFLENKLEQFLDAPSGTKGYMLGRFAKEILLLAIPAGLGVSATKSILKASKSAKFIRPLASIASCGDRIGKKTLLESVSRIGKSIKGRTIEDVSKVLHLGQKYFTKSSAGFDESKSFSKFVEKMARSIGSRNGVDFITGIPGLKYSGKGTWISEAGIKYGLHWKDGNSLRHILQHSRPNPSKPKHSVFKTNIKNIPSEIDEAWKKRGKGILQRNKNIKYKVPMGRKIGTQGEENLTIIIKRGTNDEIVTAFPGK